MLLTSIISKYAEEKIFIAWFIFTSNAQTIKQIKWLELY